jgi:hypothetical protein
MQDRVDIEYDDYTYLYGKSWSLQSLRTGTILVTSGFSGITEFGYLLSQFLGLISGDEHRLMIRDSVAGCICLGLLCPVYNGPVSMYPCT